MERIPTKEIQPLLVDILKAFHDYCRRRELVYFMSDGTLLGAVRHGGFIPWDDDIDVSMIDAEYDRLIRFAKTNPYLDDAKRYKFLLPAEYPNFYPFLKVIDTFTLAFEKDISRKYAIGLWVDVFRFSHCDAQSEATQLKYRQIMKLRELNKLAVCGNFRTPQYKLLYPFLAPVKILLRIVGVTPTVIARKMLDIEASMPTDAPNLMDITWADHAKHYFDERLWTNATLLQFEGEEFLAPARYDEVLSAQFGDYMKLPPESERVRHDFEAYYLK